MITSSLFFKKTFFNPQDENIITAEGQYDLINKLNQQKSQHKNKIKTRNTSLDSYRPENNTNNQANQFQRINLLPIKDLKRIGNQSNDTKSFRTQKNRYLSTISYRNNNNFLDSSLNSVSPWVQTINPSPDGQSNLIKQRQRQKIKNLIEHYKYEKSMQHQLDSPGSLSLKKSMKSKQFKINMSNNNKQKYISIHNSKNMNKKQLKKHVIKSLDINKTYQDYINGQFITKSIVHNYVTTSRSRMRNVSSRCIKKSQELPQISRICQACQQDKDNKRNVCHAQQEENRNSSVRCQQKKKQSLRVSQQGIQCQNCLKIISMQISQSRIKQKLSVQKEKPLQNQNQKQPQKNKKYKQVSTSRQKQKQKSHTQIMKSLQKNKVSKGGLFNIQSHKKYYQNVTTIKTPLSKRHLKDNSGKKIQFQVAGSKTRKLEYDSNAFDRGTNSDLTFINK